MLLCGAIATLVGQAAVMLNEPTQLPDVAATLVVQTAAQVTGERTLAVGLVLLALGVGFHLGGGLRPARRPTRTPARRPAARTAAPARAKAVSRTTTRTRTPDRRGANK